jgi:hypothetical protein
MAIDAVELFAAVPPAIHVVISDDKVTAASTIRHEQAFHYAVLEHIGPATDVIPTLVGFAGPNERVSSLRRQRCSIKSN